jgi:hypothetical protein
MIPTEKDALRFVAKGETMRVLVACEFSGTVRDAFTRGGHDAWSCDLLPTEKPGHHIQGDLRAVNMRDFDLVIAHPPCTYLAASGARWWAGRQAEQSAALEFVYWIRDNAPSMLAIENPIGRLSTAWRKPDQTIQPWMFGHGETKATCLWLAGLPPLEATDIVSGREPRIHHERPGPDRWARRSRTLPGIAAAMAAQWGKISQSSAPRPD